MQLAFPRGHAPDVELFRRYVEIAAEKHIAVLIAGLIKEFSETLQPVELERKFLGPKLRAVRYVSVDDAYPIDGRGNKAFRLLVIVVMKAFLNVFDLVS